MSPSEQLCMPNSAIATRKVSVQTWIPRSHYSMMLHLTQCWVRKHLAIIKKNQREHRRCLWKRSMMKWQKVAASKKLTIAMMNILTYTKQEFIEYCQGNKWRQKRKSRRKIKEGRKASSNQNHHDSAEENKEKDRRLLKARPRRSRPSPQTWSMMLIRTTCLKLSVWKLRRPTRSRIC